MPSPPAGRPLAAGVKSFVQAVPNFSEGRRGHVISALAAAAGRVEGARVLDVSSDPDHNRTVLTIVGYPEPAVAAVLAAAAVAVREIDMRIHRGVHPRVGAVDVVPFVPLRDTSMAACGALCRTLASRLWERERVPVYFYGAAVAGGAPRALIDARRGGFEALPARMADPAGAPDIGTARPHPTAGAAITGARPLLIAFNINLTTDDVAAARAIAQRVRASSGGLDGVQAMGVRLATRGIAQVSMNLFDLSRVTPRIAFEAVRREAAGLGVEVMSSEIVGLAPAFAFSAADASIIRLEGDAAAKILERAAAPDLDGGRYP